MDDSALNKYFWENKHLNNDTYWLTDSDPGYVYSLHNLGEDLKVFGKNILEIGVGYSMKSIDRRRIL